MAASDCPDCRNENTWCTAHQRADIEYENLGTGDVDKSRDPSYHALLQKYGEE